MPPDRGAAAESRAHMRYKVFSQVLAALFLSTACWGQSATAGTGQQSDTPTLRKNINLVNVFFTATDNHGALVPNLSKDSFEVFEDGKPQTIKYFGAETNLPMTLGLLIDASGNMERSLPSEKAAAGDFLRQIITDKGSIFVVSFDSSDGPTLEQGFTANIQRMRRAVERVMPEGRGSSGAPLFDAIYATAHEALGEQEGRKAMVILTDGVDVGSRLKLRDVIEAAQKADTICYALLLSHPQHGSKVGDMRQLTEETGGRTIEVNRPDKIGAAFTQISNELRNQYYIGYPPDNRKRDGSFRKIEIKTREPSYSIRARKGYYAPRD